MPISIQALATDEQTFHPEWNGQAFTVSYRPKVFTSKFQQDYRKASIDLNTDGEVLGWWYSRVVVSWDVLGADGQPLPLTPEWFATQDVVETNWLWWLVAQINLDRRPKAGLVPNGALSDAGSSATPGTTTSSLV